MYGSSLALTFATSLNGCHLHATSQWCQFQQGFGHDFLLNLTQFISGIDFVPCSVGGELILLGDGDMGRKANNLPARHGRHGQVWFLVMLKVVSCHPSMKSANIIKYIYCRQSKHSAERWPAEVHLWQSQQILVCDVFLLLKVRLARKKKVKAMELPLLHLVIFKCPFLHIKSLSPAKCTSVWYPSLFVICSSISFHPIFCNSTFLICSESQYLEVGCSFSLAFLLDSSADIGQKQPADTRSSRPRKAR